MDDNQTDTLHSEVYGLRRSILEVLLAHGGTATTAQLRIDTKADDVLYHLDRLSDIGPGLVERGEQVISEAGRGQRSYEYSLTDTGEAVIREIQSGEATHLMTIDEAEELREEISSIKDDYQTIITRLEEMS